MNFKELLGKQMLFFDGATGTQLQARGLQPGELPESWNFTHPDIVEAVHRSYLDVGSNIVKSNTFGANPLKLAGSGLDCKETIEAAVAIAKKACGGRENKFVALNLGPTGKLLAPYGDLPFEKAVEAYGEMVRYGAAAGADLILIETMSDTYEIKAAVLASKENCDLPICVTMTFDEDGKLLTGATVEAAALMCEGLGVDAIGFNCGLGPVQVGKLFPQMLAATSLPLIINPNAGLPVQRDGKTCFDVGPEEYAELMYELAGNGASIVGGCCGTTPEHIAQMIAKCKTLQPGGTRDCRLTAVSSYGKAVHLGEGPIIIGERITTQENKRADEILVETIKASNKKLKSAQIVIYILAVLVNALFMIGVPLTATPSDAMAVPLAALLGGAVSALLLSCLNIKPVWLFIFIPISVIELLVGSIIYCGELYDYGLPYATILAFVQLTLFLLAMGIRKIIRKLIKTKRKNKSS